MSEGSLTADFTVPLFGTLMCITPAITRPTVQFGVRIPAERAGAPVIRREGTPTTGGPRPSPSAAPSRP